jgi:hypothetical protein
MMFIAGPPIEWQYRSNITGSINQFSLAKMAPDCCFVRILSGRKMTDQIEGRKPGSFSFIELLSVGAILLILVMIANPTPYTSWNHGFPASQTALGRGYVDADTGSSETLKSAGGGKTASIGYASQGSPFELRTVGQREFCADMPGVVRFRTSGAPCKNGTLAANLPPHREQPRP